MLKLSSRVRRARRLSMVAVLAVACSLAASGSASAQELGFFGFGLRAGLSLDPDQAFVGVHVDLGQLAKQVYFRPNLELGSGDDQTVVAFNLAALYFFNSRWQRWEPYAGGEIGVNHREIERSSLPDVDDTEPAINAVFGIDTEMKSGDRLLFEAKLGLIEEPDFKLLVGWTF